MYWQTAAGYKIQAPTFPLCLTGTAYDVTLTLVTESGEDLTNAYLFLVQTAQFGNIQAKLASEDTYRIIGIPFDANCFLGYIAGDSETDIDFRLLLPSGTSNGRLVIPVAVGHDDGAELPNPYFVSEWPELWAIDWADQKLWNEDWQL